MILEDKKILSPIAVSADKINKIIDYVIVLNRAGLIQESLTGEIQSPIIPSHIRPIRRHGALLNSIGYT